MSLKWRFNVFISGPGLAGLVSGCLICVIWAAAVCVGMTLFAAVQRIAQALQQTTRSAAARCGAPSGHGWYSARGYRIRAGGQARLRTNRQRHTRFVTELTVRMETSSLLKFAVHAQGVANMY